MTPDENWSQGRTFFGGLLGAMAVESCYLQMPDLPDLRSAQFSLIAPSTGTLEARPTVLRTGRSTVFMGVDILSDGTVAMRAILTFGDARPSKHALNDLVIEHTTSPAGGVQLFQPPGAPKNTMNFEGRLVGGQAPFSSASTAELEMWLRHRDTRPTRHDVSMVALADASPPAVFSLFSAPAPISTVTWSIDFCGVRPDPLSWFFACTSSDYVDCGYSHQLTRMWDEAGQPVLVSRQMVALFD